MMTMMTSTFKYSHITHTVSLYDDFFECRPRSPGQDVPHVDDTIYRNGPVFVRNQARSVTVELQYSLYKVECFAKCRVIYHTLASSYSSQ